MILMLLDRAEQIAASPTLALMLFGLFSPIILMWGMAIVVEVVERTIRGEWGKR